MNYVDSESYTLGHTVNQVHKSASYRLGARVIERDEIGG